MFPVVVCFINVFVCVNVLQQAKASTIISYALSVDYCSGFFSL